MLEGYIYQKSEKVRMSHQFFFSPHIIGSLPVPATGFDVVQDIAEPRLRLYITSRGIKTFFTRKRVRGRDVRIIIGRFPDVSVEDARNAVSEKIAESAAPVKVRRNRIVFDRLFAIYLSRKVNRTEESLMKLKRTASRHWASLMQREVADITSDDLAAIHEKISETAGIATANRMLEILKSMFKFAIEQGHITKNPAADLEKFTENRRHRDLTNEEFSRLMNAIKKEKNYTLRSAFLMLVFGFAPKSAIFAMRWRDFDFNSDTWLDRPLSDPAVVLLRNVPQSGTWVFPSRGRHLTDPRKAWAGLVRKAGLLDVQMNDIYKHLSRNLAWSADREQLRANMNEVIDHLL